MPGRNQHSEEESFDAPEKLVEALGQLHKERIFVPPTVDQAVLRVAGNHLRRLERPRTRWKSWLSWAAMAACLVLAAWLAERFSSPVRARPFTREDINRDGRVDVLDAFALARRIDTGGTLDRRWDVNGDGRVDRADVNAIAARAVSLAQAGPEPKRSAGLRPDRADAVTIWSTEVRAPFFGTGRLGVNALSPSCHPFGAHPGAEMNSLGICPYHRRPRRFCGARLCEPQQVESAGRIGFVKTLGDWQRFCGSQNSSVRQKICFERAAAFALPLLLTKGGEGRGEEALFINFPSLLSLIHI